MYSPVALVRAVLWEHGSHAPLSVYLVSIVPNVHPCEGQRPHQVWFWHRLAPRVAGSTAERLPRRDCALAGSRAPSPCSNHARARGSRQREPSTPRRHNVPGFATGHVPKLVTRRLARGLDRRRVCCSSYAELMRLYAPPSSTYRSNIHWHVRKGAPARIDTERES